jgi:hypothetical protein
VKNRAAISAPGATLFGTPISGSIPYTFVINRKKVAIQGTGLVTASGGTQAVTLAVAAHK